MATDQEHYVVERLQAKRTSTLIQVVAVIGALACLAGASLLQPTINQKRRDLNLVMQSEIYKELPPKYAWVSAFGATFRGMAVNYLWIRAENLKQEGKYYESHQLARWITTIQPRFAEVWSFQAWNMAYNISVGTHTYQERWQWVYNGIRLLRDEGIPNNDRVVPLYHQLAWTLFHKVGERMDDFHHRYKRKLAAMMETVLGPPPVATSNQAWFEWFKPVADAPRQLETLIERRPQVASIVAALSSAGVDVEAETSVSRVYHPLETKFFEPYMRYLIDQRLASLREDAAEETEPQSALFKVFDEMAGEDFDALLAFMRSKVLREQYKMDPEFMLGLYNSFDSEEPVPLDWRTPYTHAIYWASYGLERGELGKHRREYYHLNTDRIRLLSLAALVKFGQYDFRINVDEPFRSFLQETPQLDFVEPMHQLYIKLGAVHKDEDEELDETTTTYLRSGHVNNLEDAIQWLYLAGRNQEAQKYLDYLATHYKNPFTKEYQEQYMQPVEDFVWTRLKEAVSAYQGVMPVILTLLKKSYHDLAAGRDDLYRRQIQQAGHFYQRYQEEAIDSPEGRLRLKKFIDLRASALFTFMTNINYPLPMRATAWYAESEEIKLRCYDALLPYLKAECEQKGFDVDRVMPAPEGIEAWRQLHPDTKLEEELFEQHVPRDDVE